MFNTVKNKLNFFLGIERNGKRKPKFVYNQIEVQARELFRT
jgi:hypothetical protein